MSSILQDVFLSFPSLGFRVAALRTLSVVLGVLFILNLIQKRAARRAAEKARGSLRENRAQLMEAAHTDYLTGLPNRVSFMEQLGKRMEQLPQGELMALADLDLDNFKDINDAYGHLYGDVAMEAVAERLRSCLQPGDLIGRVGGDEFILLFRKVEDRRDCERRMDELMEAFCRPYPVLQRELRISASAGAVIIPLDGCYTLQSAMRNLDAALLSAKESGKGICRFFDSSMEERMLKRMELQADLQRAIEENQFELYYQPQVCLETGRVTGFEALIRWNHPQKGLVLPSEFIPLAEECGLIVAIGKLVLRAACRQLKEWEQEGYHDILLAVNLSAKQFRDPQFLDSVCELIRESGIDPKNLELEITETIALDDVTYSIGMLERLKRLGISFSLDDFGTGYSSLNYLKRLPVNNLKIDKSFLDSVMESKSDQRIVETIIQLAQALELSVIAEGVEQEEQETFLKKVKCNKAQGYLYSRPVPGSAALTLLQ